MCISAYDLGVSVPGDPVAYINPACTEHNDYWNEEMEQWEEQFLERYVVDEGIDDFGEEGDYAEVGTEESDARAAR